MFDGALERDDREGGGTGPDPPLWSLGQMDTTPMVARPHTINRIRQQLVPFEKPWFKDFWFANLIPTR